MTSAPRSGPMALRPVAVVSSPVSRREDAVKQGDEGAPDCVLDLEPDVVAAAADIAPGDALVVLTWLHLAERDVLRVHPRGDTSRPPTGVFSTRSPDRPNPIGLHTVEVLSVDGPRIRVRGLEAVDGTRWSTSSRCWASAGGADADCRTPTAAVPRPLPGGRTPEEATTAPRQ
ncbi:MAG: tRNA (N6-threonylcarbamoyladenosine(37)-N6)-methyltransferase TrmO [Nocardioidaceae bacterium]